MRFRTWLEDAHLLVSAPPPPRSEWDLSVPFDLDVNDPLFERVGLLERQFRDDCGRSFFHASHISRSWTPAEWRAAEAGYVWPPRFEPAGEECGTIYDTSSECEFCHAGAVQSSDLILDVRKIPKTRVLAWSIANELVVRQDFAERMVDAGLTGFEFRPVRHKSRHQDDAYDLRTSPTGRELVAQAERLGAPYGSVPFTLWINRPEQRKALERAEAELSDKASQRELRRPPKLPVWYQLVIASHSARIAPETKVGIDPFNEDPAGKYRCPLGHTVGLNILSQVSLERATVADVDIQLTEQFVGTRRGLLRPFRPIIVSPKFLKLLREWKPPGVKLEVALLVP